MFCKPRIDYVYFLLLLTHVDEYLVINCKTFTLKTPCAVHTQQFDAIGAQGAATSESCVVSSSSSLLTHKASLLMFTNDHSAKLVRKHFRTV